MTHICNSNLCLPSLVRWWLVAWSTPSHYLSQCWNIANWPTRNKLQWNFNRNSYIFIQENDLQMPSTKWRPYFLGLNVLIHSFRCRRHCRFDVSKHFSLWWNDCNLFKDWLRNHMMASFTGEFSTQRPVTRSLMFYLTCPRTNISVNNRDANDLKRYRAHYDVIVIICLDTYLANRKAVRKH